MGINFKATPYLCESISLLWWGILPNIFNAPIKTWPQTLWKALMFFFSELHKQGQKTSWLERLKLSDLVSLDSEAHCGRAKSVFNTEHACLAMLWEVRDCSTGANLYTNTNDWQVVRNPLPNQANLHDSFPNVKKWFLHKFTDTVDFPSSNDKVFWLISLQH